MAEWKRRVRQLQVDGIISIEDKDHAIGVLTTMTDAERRRNIIDNLGDPEASSSELAAIVKTMLGPGVERGVEPGGCPGHDLPLAPPLLMTIILKRILLRVSHPNHA
jgi:hypothetical protein